jgi:glycine cleavage system H protein
MEAATMTVKEGLLYTKEHEWAKVDGDTATIGITDYAQEQLGDLVYVELPQMGRQVDAHKEIAVVESSKSASDVFSPVAGQVTEVNETLESKPESINEDCYGAGWICRLQITDRDSMGDLMDAKRYEAYLETL